MSVAVQPMRPFDPVANGLYRSLWRFASGSRLALIGGAALLVGSQLMRLALPWFVARAIDVLQVGGPDVGRRAGGWICALLATAALTWVLHGPGRILERAVGVRVRRNVSAALFDKLASAPLSWHDRHAASDLQQRMGQASGALDDFAQNQYIVLQSTITFVGTLAALVLFSPSTGAVAVVAYVALVMVGMRFDRSMMRLALLENEANRRYASGVLESVGAIVTVTALRLQASVRRMTNARLEAVFVPLRRSIRLNEAKWCVVDLLTTALTWAVVALYVWRTRDSGSVLMIGGVFMVHRYAEQAGAVVSGAASHLQGFAHARANFASAAPIWDAPVRTESAAAIDDDWSRIDLHRITYRHAAADGTLPDDAPGIDDVSLSFTRGERIALVGPSGAGKSTLMRVMAGLYDATHGHVAVDGVAQLGMRSLSSITTFIPQDADAFETTVAGNIAPDGLPAADVLRTALRTSAFDEVLEMLPDGLSTMVAERGANLSGGQRQRLCLARGVLAAAGSSMILLDEPTSALDPLTEAHVYRELTARFPDACIVASVHRMHLLAHFDRVVLMVDGRMLDCGTADQVASRQPLFAAMRDGDARPDGAERQAA